VVVTPDDQTETDDGTASGAGGVWRDGVIAFGIPITLLLSGAAVVITAYLISSHMGDGLMCFGVSLLAALAPNLLFVIAIRATKPGGYPDE
jgi:hypothetical protein